MLNIRNRKASIPVTVLVILTIALFAFALLAFSVSKNNLLKNMGKSVEFVESFNEKSNYRSFLGQPELEGDSRMGRNKFLGIISTGDEFLEISINRIKR